MMSPRPLPTMVRAQPKVKTCQQMKTVATNSTQKEALVICVNLNIFMMTQENNLVHNNEDPHLKFQISFKYITFIFGK